MHVSTTPTKNQTSPQYFVSMSFVDAAAAERALTLLAEAGIDRRRVSIVVSGEVRDRLTLVPASHAAEGAAAGGMLGAIAAGMATFVLGPPVAIVGVAGPLMAALGGAALGGAGGTLAGALVGGELPRGHAERIAEHVHNGDITITVAAASQRSADAIASLCDLAGGTRVGLDHPIVEPPADAP